MVSSIELTNFRGIRSFKQDLNKDLNFIKGVSGSGKTSILEALAVGCSFWYSPISAVSAGKINRNISKDDLRRSEGSDNISFKPNFPCQIKTTGRYNLTGECGTWIRNYGEKTGRTDTKHNGTMTFPDPKNISAFPVFSYYGNNGFWIPNSISSLLRTGKKKVCPSMNTDGIKDCMKDTIAPSNINNWIVSEICNYAESKKFRERYNTLSKILSKTVPCFGSIVGTDVSSGIVVIKEFGTVPGVTTRTKLISDLNYSYGCMFFMVADLAIRCLNLMSFAGTEEDVQNIHGTVLIDGLDNHMNTSSVISFMKNMKACFKNIQFVVTMKDLT